MKRRGGPGSHPALENFLVALHDGEREAFLQFAELSSSNYEIWIYATVLGYSGRFSELVEWAADLFPKSNRRELLQEEAHRLEADIAQLRELAMLKGLAPDIAASRVAVLSKELRGHLAEIEKMSRATDRRGLVLAGADRVMRELRAIFRGNEEIMDALEPAFVSVWGAITEEI
jgi:hypothetical protein